MESQKILASLSVLSRTHGWTFLSNCACYYGEMDCNGTLKLRGSGYPGAEERKLGISYAGCRNCWRHFTKLFPLLPKWNYKYTGVYLKSFHFKHSEPQNCNPRGVKRCSFRKGVRNSIFYFATFHQMRRLLQTNPNPAMQRRYFTGLLTCFCLDSPWSLFRIYFYSSSMIQTYSLQKLG